MNTYTLIITWNVACPIDHILTSKHICDSYAATMKMVDSYKTNDRFISAFIKKN